MFDLLLDGIHTNASPSLVTTGLQTIGGPGILAVQYYDGYLDQLTILFDRAKSAEEILVDATLVAHYSMDCLSYSALDSGPNQINGIAIGLSSGDGGRVGQSVLFSSNASYFQATELVLLGQSYRSFSFALWLRPITSVTTGGTILHVSQYNNGTGWCAQFIGLSSSGQIVAYVPGKIGAIQITGPVLTIDQWVHVVLTYSKSNGLRLYINGKVYGESARFIYAAADSVAMTVTLGQPLNGGSCDRGTIQSGHYRGEIDEFYIFSRELAKADVQDLMNP